ncbi:nucleotidyltransferase family protein [Anabaena sp. CCY 9910]|uniref:nucleotidyltransferase family protein n=1 Tax=Anabaena sp. CCY 9910 TaxID=3103870 RepID=UPI0039E021F8
MESHYEEQLIHIIRATPWFMAVLSTVRELALPSWCIGAGVIRNLVWDALHGVSKASYLSDVDVAYFDPSDISMERDKKLQLLLSHQLPDIPWEVTNQAGVHIWFESVFGYAVTPLSSLEEAIATWPEYTTAVGVTLEADDNIRVIAPFGLNDLFGMIVRRNPTRVSVETYRKRIEQKQYVARWPMVTVISC